MLKEDRKQYNTLIKQFESLTTENYIGAYNLSHKALILADRWNDIQIMANDLKEEANMAKSDLQKWAYGRYRILSMIHEKCRVIWRIGEEQQKYFERQSKRN